MPKLIIIRVTSFLSCTENPPSLSTSLTVEAHVLIRSPQAQQDLAYTFPCCYLTLLLCIAHIKLPTLTIKSNIPLTEVPERENTENRKGDGHIHKISQTKDTMPKDINGKAGSH